MNLVGEEKVGKPGDPSKKDPNLETVIFEGFHVLGGRFKDFVFYMPDPWENDAI